MLYWEEYRKLGNVLVGLHSCSNQIANFRGWLGWGSQKQQESLTKSKMVDDTLYRSSDLPMEVSIPDNRRSILSIAVSPLGNLAALVDSFGRVILLDCDNLVVRRMWKGMCDIHFEHM